ncbi:hypothetical protein ACHWQZ_G001586 [Mnemiopsis leidyi]
MYNTALYNRALKTRFDEHMKTEGSNMTEKSGDTALTSTWRCAKYNPPTKCKCHIYLALADNSLTLGTQPHNHSADGSVPARQEVLLSLKRKAADQPLSATQDPDFPRTSNMVEGFHRGFKTRVNRPKPSVQEYVRAVKEEQVMTDFHLDRLSVGKRRRTCHTHLHDICSFYSTYPSKIDYVFAVAKYFGNDIE